MSYFWLSTSVRLEMSRETKFGAHEISCFTASSWRVLGKVNDLNGWFFISWRSSLVIFLAFSTSDHLFWSKIKLIKFKLLLEVTKNELLYLFPSFPIRMSGSFDKRSRITELMLILEVLDKVLWEFVHNENNEKKGFVFDLYQLQETTAFS